MRLYDRIKAKGILPEMPVIVADEIASQFDDLPIDGHEDKPFPADWYGNVAPPFNEFWVEARSYDSGRYQPGVTAIEERGVWAKVIESDDQLLTIHFPNARWVLVLRGFEWSNVLGEMTFDGAVYIGIREDGRLLFDDSRLIADTQEFYTTRAIESGFARNRIMPVSIFSGYTIFFLKAVNAMHQRVEVAEITPTRQMNRFSERKHGIKLNKYYFLKVKPYELKSIEDFKNIGKPDKKDNRREHAVRGHFKYYHPDKPLFGRIGLSGMVWIPDHERGNYELGKIEKGYTV